MLAYSAADARGAGSAAFDFSYLMPSPLIVVVVVTLADSGSDATHAMTRTVQEALADTALVMVHEEARPDDNVALTNLGNTMHANAVVVVQWNDTGHASVRVYRTELKAWTTRDVAFNANDPPNERGRTLGFGIASIVRAGTPEEPEKPPPPPPAPRDAPAASGSTAALPRWDAEAAGQASLANSATSWGGSVGAGFRVVDRLTLRASFAGRAGSIDDADASSTYLRVTGGTSWALAFHRFTFGPRLEVGAIRQQASRSDASSGARWSGVVDARAEASAFVIPRLAIVLGVGGEVVLQRVPIRVDTMQVTSLPPARMVGSLGVRLTLD